MGKELGIVEEFCKDTRGAVVRECPDCVDAYIKLAEKYRDRVEVLENTIAAANANAALWKRDHDVLKLQNRDTLERLSEARRLLKWAVPQLKDLAGRSDTLEGWVGHEIIPGIEAFLSNTEKK